MKKQYTRKQIQEAIKHWKTILESMNENNDSTEDKKEMTEAELNEERGRGICDAFNSIYKETAKQLQAEQAAEMEQWKKLLAAHNEKMADIKRRRAEAMANFQNTRAQLKKNGVEVDVEDLDAIADQALDLDNM